MARKQSSSDDAIHLTALNPNGRLGSYYDGYRESILEQFMIRNEDKSSKSIKKIDCQLIKGKANQCTNLLQMINMPVALRTSILLNLTPKSWIGSIMDYPHLINEHTRFLYYRCVRQEERLTVKITKMQKMDKIPPSFDRITHIITGVNYGIEAILIVQLPTRNDLEKKLHAVLESIHTAFNNDQSPSTIIQENADLLKQITSTTVYSNIPALMGMSSVRDMCLYIDATKNDVMNYPVMYTLRPICWMFPKHDGQGVHFASPAETFCEKVERYLLDFSSTVHRVKHALDDRLAPILCEQLAKQLDEARTVVITLTKKYSKTVKRFHDLILEIRRNRSTPSFTDRLLTDMENKSTPEIAKLIKLIKHLEEKAELITNLKEQKIIYCNAINRHVTRNDNEKTLMQKLKINNRIITILCTTDELNKKDPRKYTEYRRLVAAECEGRSESVVVYADFSYCHFTRDKMILVHPLLNKKKKKKKPVKRSPSPPVTPDTADEVVNILLLGESGVGKSTFINAFVNYLTSETFDRAQSNPPVVLIPVSFLITTGDHFDEHTIKFGDFITSHNEDFDHPGESVTQHCKSYEFHLDRDDGKRLCIIDTPGFGDTRGLDQDDLNMQDIFEYVNNLTHLDAVCFLLKPNLSELHTFFRRCFTELIDLLGPKVHQNIIFCFTNARSTFYTPGDTARALKSLLKSQSLTDIPFRKENAFCFDNEAFRYLVALQNSITFNDLDRSEYERSWQISVRESHRLIDYICKDLHACSIHSEWKSNKHAQVIIRDLIRPMLETMRNILRNVLLHEIESPHLSIEFCPRPMHCPGAVCSTCTFYPIRVSQFWIVQEMVHEFRKNCFDCSCERNKHTLINYTLNYEVIVGPSIYQQNRILDKAHELCHSGAEFDFFLSEKKHRPFAKGLQRMIDEETILCENQNPNHLNIRLLQSLTQFQREYTTTIEKFQSIAHQTTLTNLYRSITLLQTYPPIHDQLNTIKETQKLLSEPYEIPSF